MPDVCSILAFPSPEPVRRRKLDAPYFFIEEELHLMKFADSRLVLASSSILILALSVPSPECRAESITYNVVLNTKTQPGFVPLFDPSLGTLREVIFSASGSAGAEVHVLPDPISAGTYRQIVDIVFITLPNGFTVLGSQDLSVDFTLDPPTSSFTVGTEFSISSDILTGLDRFQETGSANIQIAVQFTLTSPPV